MKRTLLVVAIACVGLLTAAVSPAQSATVSTNKTDYAPGETVIITGTGWSPGETVMMILHETPTTHEDEVLSSIADANGNFTNTSWSPGGHDAGVSFELTATGQTSGLVATTTFTDAPGVPGALLQPGSAAGFEIDAADHDIRARRTCASVKAARNCSVSRAVSSRRCAASVV